jgi:hypothetical protein
MSSARNFTNLWSNLCTRKGVCGVGGIRTSNQLTLSQVLTDSSDCILVRRSAVNALGTCCFCLGNSVCLIGALVMVAGESILGENHTGMASVIGIVGIGLIGTSGGIFAASAKPKN